MWEEEQKREVATRRRRRMTSRDAKSNSSGTDAKLAPKKLLNVRRRSLLEKHFCSYTLLIFRRRRWLFTILTNLEILLVYK